jgi:uroporphyrinogen-III synthase
VHNLAGLAEAAGQNLSEYLAGARIACIGPITAQAARAGGLAVELAAAEHSMEGLVAALVEHRIHPTEQMS